MNKLEEFFGSPMYKEMLFEPVWDIVLNSESCSSDKATEILDAIAPFFLERMYELYHDGMKSAEGCERLSGDEYNPLEEFVELV